MISKHLIIFIFITLSSLPIAWRSKVLPKKDTQISCKAFECLIPELLYNLLIFEIWRRERDSNPRYGFPYTRVPGVRLQPLGHLSRIPALYSEKNSVQAQTTYATHVKFKKLFYL